MQFGIGSVKTTAHQSTHASQQFCQGKRLGQIVICAGIQSGNALLD
jgi:hypothetical protein